MVEVAHDNDMKIEAWVNPYRVTTGSTNYKKLAKNNQARKWHAKKSTRRNVLSYGGSLYYNPSKKGGQNTDHKRSERNRTKIMMSMEFIWMIISIPYPNPGEDFPDHVSFCAIWSRIQ